MTRFSSLWDTEVRQLAQNCVTEPKLIELMCKANSYKATDEEKEYLKEMSAKYKDIYGMYYISDMIGKVEHALADGREPLAKLAVTNVYSVLSRPSYFQNLFDENEDDEEWKVRKALCDGLRKLLNY